MVVLPETESIEVRDIWEDNLEEEFEFIRNIVDEYYSVAMDTEFPGLAMKPLAVAEVTDPLDHQYEQVKLNVDHLKMIQLGLTFSDADGNLPHRDKDLRSCVWQFNFQEFNPMHDLHAIDSIALLIQSGIQFERNIQEGVSSSRFGELLMSSGIVLSDNMCYVTFHGVLDFGFLMKLVTCRKLPDTRAGFYELLQIFVPVMYDVKYLMQFCGMYGGLDKVVSLLWVERVGVCHQAGSDSLVTARVFKKLMDNNFGGRVGRYVGVLYRLGV